MSLKIDHGNIWITSDTHFGHAGIVRGTTHWRIMDADGNKIVPLDAVRDFDTVEEMNEMMISNINDCVGEHDTLFHMGDWSFGGFENISEFRYRINCKNIHFIIGNHDHHIESNKENIRRFFASVNSYNEVNVAHKSGNLKLVLCHYPIVSWNNMRKNSYMIHGHQHLKGDQRFGNGKRMDVGMCGHPEFRPYNLDEIVEILRNSESYEIENRSKEGKLIR
jgi:calcineurin-like phosphoesterase family protein